MITEVGLDAALQFGCKSLGREAKVLQTRGSGKQPWGVYNLCRKSVIKFYKSGIFRDEKKLGQMISRFGFESLLL